MDTTTPPSAADRFAAQITQEIQGLRDQIRDLEALRDRITGNPTTNHSAPSAQAPLRPAVHAVLDAIKRVTMNGNEDFTYDQIAAEIGRSRHVTHQYVSQLRKHGIHIERVNPDTGPGEGAVLRYIPELSTTHNG